MLDASTGNNFDEALGALEAKVGGTAVVRAELRNVTEYADALHAKDGYFVFNPRHFRVQVYLAVKALMSSDQAITPVMLKNAAEYACNQEIDWLTSTTAETQPPVRAETLVTFTTDEGEDVEFVAYKGEDEGKRYAHPGHWADVRGQLASAYEHDVALLAA